MGCNSVPAEDGLRGSVSCPPPYSVCTSSSFVSGSPGVSAGILAQLSAPLQAQHPQTVILQSFYRRSQGS